MIQSKKHFLKYFYPPQIEQGMVTRSLRLLVTTLDHSPTDATDFIMGRGTVVPIKI